MTTLLQQQVEAAPADHRDWRPYAALPKGSLQGALAKHGASHAEEWQKKRRMAKPEDRALKGSTIDWLLTLPKEVRPNATVDRYPRVLNQIADVWWQPAAVKACFDNLLYDKRSGRKGFPSDIKRELKILRFHRVATAD